MHFEENMRQYGPKSKPEVIQLERFSPGGSNVSTSTEEKSTAYLCDV